ncbi:hypothetical protein R3P38DRAFT_666660 [Favolaschia claudopus]|uniref:RRM domain-containing protein n=1 Tax=Favolaschia claudopus TaxID=2862362 RepID=A0AAW0EBJ2_9AGAR
MSRLYLRNLPHTTQDDIKRYLEKFGKLTEFKIVGESETFTYAFAQYDSPQDARFVLDTFRDQLFLGHRTVIELARPLRKDMSYPEVTQSWQRTRIPPYEVEPKYYPNRPCRYPVHVDKIPRNICWQELKDFGRLAGGDVAFCNLDPSRNGHGFIEYFCWEDAEEAIRMLNGQKLGGCAVRVSTHSKFARSRSRSRSPIRRPRRSHESRKFDESRHTRTSRPSSYARRSPEGSSDRLSSPWHSNYALPPIDSHSDWCSPYDEGDSNERTAERGNPMVFHSFPVTTSNCATHRELPLAPAMSADPYDFDDYLRLLYESRFDDAVNGSRYGSNSH